ncbi:hypothetical protein AURDEDRAFT_171073 [Auricularia subglabra TFB-10046 SS5]|nr:hypothetical protein AURDEDRAFT_171073 [Auricularia subglabra TFB-10046 SS5]
MPPKGKSSRTSGEECESFTNLFRTSEPGDQMDGNRAPAASAKASYGDQSNFCDSAEFGQELIDVVAGVLSDMPDLDCDDAEIVRWARTDLHEIRTTLHRRHIDEQEDIADDVAELRGTFKAMQDEIADLKKKLSLQPSPELSEEIPLRGSDPDRLHFLSLIRDHMATLLPADKSGRRAAALPSEVFSFESGVGRGPSEANFTVDMDPTRLHLSRWNKAAAVIFTRTFLRVKSTKYTQVEVVAGFYTNMRSVQNRQRIATDGLSARDEESMRRNRVLRRQWTLFDQRLFVVMHFKALRHLISVMNALGPDGMSPDSSDSEHVVRTNHPDRPAYRRKRVHWRSLALTKILHEMDVLYHYLRTLARSTGRGSGNWPRLRVDSLDGLDLAAGPPVSGLPRNCYDKSWHKSLDEDALFWLKPGRARAELTLPTELQSIISQHSKPETKSAASSRGKASATQPGPERSKPVTETTAEKRTRDPHHVLKSKDFLSLATKGAKK